MFNFTVKLKNENYIEILTKPWRNKLLFELKKWYPGTAEGTADQIRSKVNTYMMESKQNSAPNREVEQLQAMEYENGGTGHSHVCPGKSQAEVGVPILISQVGWWIHQGLASSMLHRSPGHVQLCSACPGCTTVHGKDMVIWRLEISPLSPSCQTGFIPHHGKAGTLSWPWGSCAF